MNLLFKYLRARRKYSLGIAASTALFLIVQYPKIDIFLDSLFTQATPPKAKIVHQPNLVDFRQGNFLIRNPVSETNPSIKNWSIEIKSQPEGCSVEYLEALDRAGQSLSIMNSGITSTNNDTPINPGTFIWGKYELKCGKLDDIILSADNFSTSLKIQKVRKEAQRKKALLLKLGIYFTPILILLFKIYEMYRENKYLRLFILNKSNENPH